MIWCQWMDVHRSSWWKRMLTSLLLFFLGGSGWRNILEYYGIMDRILPQKSGVFLRFIWNFHGCESRLSDLQSVHELRSRSVLDRLGWIRFFLQIENPKLMMFHHKEFKNTHLLAYPNSVYIQYIIGYLGGGFKYLLFSTLFGEDSQFD